MSAAGWLYTTLGSTLFIIVTWLAYRFIRNPGDRASKEKRR